MALLVELEQAAEVEMGVALGGRQAGVAEHRLDGPQVAAALKQVPSCEFFPIQAVKTNVLGAENVLRAAIANNVKKAIVLSTDKAVYPINAMGMSKAMMEKVMVAYSRQQPENGTVLCGTRYGNVMASRGSVIPLFIEQIKTGKPITITDPTMTRYLMSLEEAESWLFMLISMACREISLSRNPRLLL